MWCKFLLTILLSTISQITINPSIKILLANSAGGMPVLVTVLDQYYPYYKHQLDLICCAKIFDKIHLPCLCTNDLSEICSFVQILLHTENGVPDSKAAR